MRKPSSFLIAVALLAASVRAAADGVVLVPSVVVARTQAGDVLRRPLPADGKLLATSARQLDAVLAEAAQDLGLTLDVSERAEAEERALTEEALITRARSAWVFSPRLRLVGNAVQVRLVAVAPGSRVLLVRNQSMDEDELGVRAMVMMRDLVEAGRHERGEPGAQAPGEEPETAHHARSQGRAVLALNSAALGGYVGYSIQVASGSSDSRLTYPLIALGAGIGLGGSMIVADEWDVGLGDAWYLSAGTWWPLASGLLLADGYAVDPSSDRYAYGLIGASAGITLATVSLSLKGMGEGGAALTHSGGAIGLLLGAMTQWGYEGDLESSPSRGMGYGAGAGVLLTGVAATQLHVGTSRVLMIDLGAMLGALTGAAAASPLAFAGTTSKGKNRAFVGATAAGLVAGGTIGFLTTRPSSASAEPGDRWAMPYAGVIAESSVPNGAPAYGAGLVGVW